MNPERREVPAAEARYPDVFEVIDSAITYIGNAIDRQGLPAPASHLMFVRIAAVMRAFNILKSIRQLIANDHWEDATILIRSLFELVLNVEEISRDPKTAEERAERFVRYETLQKYLRRKAEFDYEVRTGRQTQQDAQLIAIEKDLLRHCQEWVITHKDGTVKWKKSWCGKNVRQLCEASGDPIRIGQYEIVYSRGSAMTHSSPASVLSTFSILQAEDVDELWKQTDAAARRETLLTMSLGVTLACEVIARAEFVGGTFDPVRVIELTRGLYPLLGAHPPPMHPVIQAMVAARSEVARNMADVSGSAQSVTGCLGKS